MTIRFTHLVRAISPPYLAGLLALLYFFGAVAYSVIVPIFEGPDEGEHFSYVTFVTENWRIPDVIREYGAYTAQGTHGPLYYFVAATFVAPINLSDTSPLPLRNPQATGLNIDSFGNLNNFVHTPLEAWPYHYGVVRAIHIARLVSATFGALAVAATVLLASRHSKRVAITSGLIVGSLPEFLFLGGLVNNEVPGAALSTWGLLFLLRYWERPGWKSALLAGLFTGLATLTKIGGIGLLLLGAITVLSRRRARLRPMAIEALLMLLAFISVCGWWLILNMVRYGDPTGIDGGLSLLPGMQIDYTNPANVYTMIRHTVFSFWAVFGRTNIAAPDWMYVVLSILALIALIGCLLVGRLEKHRAVVILCFAWALMSSCVALAWVIKTPSWHGRHLFVALSAYAILISVGIDGWRRRWRYGILLYLLPIGMLLFACLSPPLLIMPAYAAPPTAPTLPPHVEPICLVFQGRCQGCSCAPEPFDPRQDARCALAQDQQLADVELLGVDLPHEVQPGDTLTATFYWRSMDPMTYDLMLSVHMLDNRLRSIASENTYQGQGNWPTKLWQPGTIYVDTVRMHVSDKAKVPSLAPITLSMDRYGENVVASCHGVPIEFPVVGSVRIVKPLPRPTGSVATFGDKLILASATWDDTVRVHKYGPDWRMDTMPTFSIDLVWYVEKLQEDQLTRFVHLQHLGKLYAQSDGIPAGFPARVWRTGDVLPERVFMPIPPELPPGTYTLYAGVYNKAGIRLNSDTLDDQVLLGKVEITR